MSATPEFVELTEISGDMVTPEQVERICQRYFWAGEYCRGKDVLEVACGTGQGVGYLAGLARTFTAADNSDAILQIARLHYGDRYRFQKFDAQQLPFNDSSLDVVIIFEAIYYLPDAVAFFEECWRVLRPGGVLLIATANKDLFDFNPSPHSFRYFGIPEFEQELGKIGFKSEFFGGVPVGDVSARQKILRPVKMVAARLGLIPKSMAAKKLLKKLVFGSLVRMPAEISVNTGSPARPVKLLPGSADKEHKVLFCAARKSIVA